MSDQDAFNAGLCDFLSRATTPFHAVATMVEQLEVSRGWQRMRTGHCRLAAGILLPVTAAPLSLSVWVRGRRPAKACAWSGHTPTAPA